MNTISTVGLDIAKSVFQVHGIDESGQIVVRRQLKRRQVLPFFAKFSPCLIGLEACATSHHWAREIGKLGHEVRLMPPHYVKPYVKRNKNDAADAAAICEAVTRPTMRFVAVKGHAMDQNPVICYEFSRVSGAGADRNRGREAIQAAHSPKRSEKSEFTMLRALRSTQIFFAFALSLLICGVPAMGADELEPLRGKTVRVVIGSSAGGTNDTVVRAFFDAVREVLPDTTVRLQNLRGSGGAKAIKELQDATGRLVTVATFNNAPLFGQIASPEELPYDLGQVAWIGAIRKTPRVLGLRTDLGISTLNEMRNMERQPVIGTGDALNSSTLNTYLLNSLLGLKMRVVTGMDDPEQDAMLLSGDLDVKLGGVNELKPQFDADLLVPIAALTADQLPSSLQSLPTVREAKVAYIADDIAALFETLNSVNSIVAASPATKPDTIDALRVAFDRAAKRPEFVASMEARGIAVDPTSGIVLSTRLEQIFGSSSSALRDEFRSLLDCGKQLSAASTVSCK